MFMLLRSQWKCAPMTERQKQGRNQMRYYIERWNNKTNEVTMFSITNRQRKKTRVVLMVSIHSPFIFPFFHILFKTRTREDGIRYISNANIFMDFKSLHAPKILAKIVYYYLQHRLHVHEISNNLWTLQTGMPHKIYLSIITYRILCKIL